MHLIEVYCLTSEFVKFLEEKILQKIKLEEKVAFLEQNSSQLAY